MQIKIFDFNLTPLTVLQLVDVNDVVYENQLNGDGYCEFTCSANNAKITRNIVEMYNRVKIYEGAKCVFYGYITDNNYTLNTITVRCVSLSNILKKKLIQTNSVNGTIASIIQTLITNMNAYENTGITAGNITISGSVVKSYNNDTVDYVLNDLVGNAQSYIDTDGKLHVKDVYGKDKTGSVILKYDTRQIQNSNLNNFVVKESSEPIFTEIVGKDNFGTVTVVQNASFVASYGKLQAQKLYSNVNGTGAGLPYLVAEAQKDLADRSFSPELSLSPKVADTFDVGDIVKVKLYNKFIDIDTNYQILVKTVNYIGIQKIIKIRVNDKQKTIIDLFDSQQKRISQLENQ
jgi:hypothetical protein